MKKFKLFLLFPMFLIFFGGASFAFEFDKTPNRYDRQDVRVYENVLELVRGSRLEEAEKVVCDIKDYELRWMGYYLIAMDGYASQGKIDKAVELVNEIKRLMNELVVYPQEDLFEGTRQQFLGHVIISAVENGHWKESLRIFSLLTRPFYYFQGVENVVLRLPDKTTVEEFLSQSQFNYHPFHRQSTKRVVYKNSHFLMVVYGQDDEVIGVAHLFTPKDLKKLKESQ